MSGYQVLADLIGTLRSCGAFVEVAAGSPAGQLSGPRAAVMLEAQEFHAADDSHPQWAQASLAVTIQAPAGGGDDSAKRLDDLCGQARAALLADPTRGGLCEDVPAGPATAVEKVTMAAMSGSAMVEARLAVRCRWVGDGWSGAITLDAMAMFGLGRHQLVAGSWQRAMQRRSIPGLDGELVLDMGLRSRTIRQTGRLHAPTAAELAAQIAAIEALIDGRLHILDGGMGQTYANVLLEQFEQTTPIRTGPGSWCGYECTYRQLP